MMARWSTDPVQSPLRGIARARACRRRRESSWDRTGGNKDSIRIAAGSRATLLDTSGAGIVTHIWCTINSEDPHALRSTLVRMLARPTLPQYQMVSCTVAERW